MDMQQNTQRILVLNPNSSLAVTDKMREGCHELRLPPGQEVTFATLASGPVGIETQRDVESVVLPTCAYFQANPAAAYVIGCFSDPGLLLAREELAAPVTGIAEASFLAAMTLGERFGIVSIKEGSIVRHRRAVGAIGATARLAGDRALDLGVADLLDEERSVGRILEVGRVLRDKDRADVLILGCATMGVYRARIETTLGVPVVDPTQAAIVQASTLLEELQREDP